MRILYYILFLLFASHSSYALEYSCIDKKHGDLSKMTVDGDSVKYEDQNGEPLEYKIVENSEIALMAISKVSTKENPMFDVLSCERALNGNAIKVIHSVNNGEFVGETMVMWNPEKGGLQSWYFTSAGSLTIQNVQIKKDTFISIENVARNQNGITKVKTIMEVLNEDQIKKRTKYLMNNMWKDGSEIVYNKVNSLKPVFH